MAAQHEKVGILLVALGRAKPPLRSLENIDKKSKPIILKSLSAWHTVGYYRGKLAKQGKYLDSPAVVLAKMQDEKFTHVAVHSLHPIGGEEYHDLRCIVGAFKIMGDFRKSF